MAKFKKILIIMCAICMIFSMGVTALASEAADPSETPDYDRKGSVTVEMLSADTEKAIPGGTLTLYKVAAAKQVNGNHIFELTDDFKESGISLTGISESDAGTRELASELEDYVKRNQSEGKTIAVDGNGQAEWKNLELGLYLVTTKTAAKGYEPIGAFLITVPRYLDGVYVYDVKANPKQGTAEAVLSKTSVTPIRTTSPGTKLPQTGQLWWPVPVLACAGVLCLVIGWYRRRRFEEDDRAQ